MTQSAYKWVVWWYESDAIIGDGGGGFSGRTHRHYRDFKSASSARAFKNKPSEWKKYYAPISSCPWHHQHASV